MTDGVAVDSKYKGRRKEELRRLALERIERQVAEGKLLIRQATAEEREEWERQRRAHRR